MGHFPLKVVLYAGRQAVRMAEGIEESALAYRYRLVDVRCIDGEHLLVSERLEDNIEAVLTRLSNERLAVRRIMSRIAGAEPAQRAQAMAELAILAGLRNLGTIERGDSFDAHSERHHAP